MRNLPLQSPFTPAELAELIKTSIVDEKGHIALSKDDALAELFKANCLPNAPRLKFKVHQIILAQEQSPVKLQDEKEKLESKEPETIYQALFDFDGCVFDSRYGAHYKRYGNQREAVRTCNDDLIDYIISKVHRNNCTSIVVESASNRQEYELDQSNAIATNNGSSFPALESIFKRIKEYFLATQLSTHLLADNFSHREVGQSLQLALEALDDPDKLIDHPRAFWDEKKITLLYSKMHRLASENPHAKIICEFFDDRQDILRALRNFFKNNLDLIPSNVTLNLLAKGNVCDYDAGNNAIPNTYNYSSKPIEYASLVGTGTPDSHYAASIRCMYFLYSDETGQIDQEEIKNNIGHFKVIREKYRNLQAPKIDPDIKVDSKETSEQARDACFQSIAMILKKASWRTHEYLDLGYRSQHQQDVDFYCRCEYFFEAFKKPIRTNPFIFRNFLAALESRVESSTQLEIENYLFQIFNNEQFLNNEIRFWNRDLPSQLTPVEVNHLIGSGIITSEGSLALSPAQTLTKLIENDTLAAFPQIKSKARRIIASAMPAIDSFQIRAPHSDSKDKTFHNIVYDYGSQTFNNLANSSTKRSLERFKKFSRDYTNPTSGEVAVFCLRDVFLEGKLRNVSNNKSLKTMFGLRMLYNYCGNENTSSILLANRPASYWVKCHLRSQIGLSASNTASSKEKNRKYSKIISFINTIVDNAQNLADTMFDVDQCCGKARDMIDDLLSAKIKIIDQAPRLTLRECIERNIDEQAIFAGLRNEFSKEHSIHIIFNELGLVTREMRQRAVKVCEVIRSHIDKRLEDKPHENVLTYWRTQSHELKKLLQTLPFSDAVISKQFEIILNKGAQGQGEPQRVLQDHEETNSKSVFARHFDARHFDFRQTMSIFSHAMPKTACESNPDNFIENSEDLIPKI